MWSALGTVTDFADLAAEEMGITAISSACGANVAVRFANILVTDGTPVNMVLAEPPPAS